MVQFVITSWRNAAELLAVREELYPSPSSPDDLSEGNGLRQLAIDKVSVWMQRGNCPHLVESTAILTSARLNDVPSNSNYCIRAAYSAAFSRFVTGLLDSNQKARQKLSMYSIAKTIGLPATFVELRHQATHEELPSLPKLRSSTEKALQWIWEYYWIKLSTKPIVTPHNSSDCREYVEVLLGEKKKYSDAELESRLRQWDSGQVRAALLEITQTTSDATVMLEASRLIGRYLEGTESGGEDAAKVPVIKSIEEVRAELDRMRNGLQGEDEEETREQRAGHTDDGAGEKGWALWEGPWIPTPIGTVS